MAIIKPFRGLVYNQEEISQAADVVAPPYDVISPEMQDELYSRSPYNVVRLELGKEFPKDNARNNRYARAKGFLEAWLNESILIQDREPALYVYAQNYSEGGRKKSRVGFIALMKLEDFTGKKVLPHENTFKEPKEDRFRLIRHTAANISPIFSLYNDKGKVRPVLLSQRAKAPPFIDIHSDDVRHRVWRLTDEARIKKVARAMRSAPIFIADGHHRYEVALQFRNEMRRVHKDAPGAYDYVMMYFADMDPAGMTILAAHRLIKDIGALTEDIVVARLRRYFTVTRLNAPGSLYAWLEKSKHLSHQFGLYMDRDAYMIKLRDARSLHEMGLRDKSEEWKALDVSCLHHLVLKKILDVRDAEGNVVYTRDPREAVREVDEGRYRMAFLLNPTKMSQVESIARNRELMPHKSTYFYPKLLSGLVINQLCE